MNLKKSILFVIVAIVYGIIIKFSHFVSPNLFHSVTFIQIISILSFFASFSVILFGIYFIREAVEKENVRLKTAVYLAMISPGFVMYIHFTKLIHLTPDLSLPLYEKSPELYNQFIADFPSGLAHLVLWLGSLFVFYCFYVLFTNINENYIGLRKATYVVLFASGLSLALRTFGQVIYQFFPDSFLRYNPPLILYITGILISFFMSLACMNLFVKLYRVNDYLSITKI